MASACCVLCISRVAPIRLEVGPVCGGLDSSNHPRQDLNSFPTEEGRLKVPSAVQWVASPTKSEQSVEVMVEGECKAS